METSTSPADDRAWQKADPREFIRAFLAIESAYHNHKEQMAYVIATLYLAAAGYILTTEQIPLSGDRLFLIASLVIAVGGIAFVFWQLRNRRGAHVNVTAAYRLLSRWHTMQPTRDDLRPETTDPKYRRYCWPRALVLEIPQAREATWSEDRGLLVAEVLTIAVLVAVGTLAVVRILRGG
jgi:hypothetical protein